MTDRVHALTVVLDRDIRIDDLEPLVTAISLLRGVASVTSTVTTSSDFIARERVRIEMRTRMFDALETILSSKP